MHYWLTEHCLEHITQFFQCFLEQREECVPRTPTIVRILPRERIRSKGIFFFEKKPKKCSKALKAQKMLQELQKIKEMMILGM